VRTALTFLWGAVSLGSWVVGLFFFRFWRVTRDRFFAFFGAAFWVLSLSWAALALLTTGDESLHLVYAIRVLAFLLIIAGILDKNRPRGDR
jgi:hypothetical protein